MLFCPVRKSWRNDLPEEKVRIHLLEHMISNLGFPAGHLALEKELSQLPQLAECKHLPQRRADIICFAKGIHPQWELFPLLLIECKAVKLTQPMVSQLLGYNHYLKAPYVCLVNHEETRTGWLDRQTNRMTFIPFLPSYQELEKSLRL